MSNPFVCAGQMFYIISTNYNMHNYVLSMIICLSVYLFSICLSCFVHLNSLILSLYQCTQFNCEKYDNQSLIGQMDRLLDSAHCTIVSEANGIYTVTYHHILNSISKVIST